MNASSIHHTDDATRRSLIERVKNPLDNESWQDFFQTYWKLIYHLALRCGLNDSEAEEVVQTTMIAVSQNIPRFDYNPAKGRFRNWLLQQARWKINDLIRQRGRERHVVPIQPRDAASRVTSDDTRTATAHRVADEGAWTRPDGSWSETMHSAAVAAVRAQMSVKQYQIFDLYVLRRWPAKRVAATLGVRRLMLYLWAARARNVYEEELRRIVALENSSPGNA